MPSSSGGDGANLVAVDAETVAGNMPQAPETLEAPAAATIIEPAAPAAALVTPTTTMEPTEEEEIVGTSLSEVTSANLARRAKQDSYFTQVRPKRGSVKLQPSPSSVSSRSNTSSLFRDDGFEDDLASSTASEHQFAYHNHHRLSFQGRSNASRTASGRSYLASHYICSRHRSNSGCAGTNHDDDDDDDDQYQTPAAEFVSTTRSPGYWDSNLSITQRVVTEIIETERTYVDDLEQIVTGYICYLRNVLKQQKHQPLQDVTLTNVDASSGGSTASGVDDDDKSMLVFDEDATSATNEVEDYEEVENDELVADEDDEIKKLCSRVGRNLHCSTPDAGAMITACHIKKLFSNLEDIYKFNKDLLFRLEECYLNPSSVAECFVENSSGFEVYTHYCTMYPQVVSTLTELMANQTSAQLLRERQNELNQSLPLGAYLLKPVQRILKYHLLFQSLIKHTNDDSSVDEKDRQLISEAFSVMTGIACHINAMKKRHEHAIRVQEVQGLLCGWEGPDLTTLGELILEDTFKLCGRPKTSRHLFLFDNVLLITKMKREGSLCYKGHITCSNLMLIENIEGQPLVFNTVPFDNPKALCAFQAKNLDKKRDWCLQMKEVIIKSFEVKIPVHVKEILMSLTNSCGNNTDASNKSSSETSRALRAPNYLERKRMKQDKRRH